MIKIAAVPPTKPSSKNIPEPGMVLEAEVALLLIQNTSTVPEGVMEWPQPTPPGNTAKVRRYD